MMGLKELVRKFIYPDRYSSEALIKHIRAGGGKVSEITVVFLEVVP